MRLPVFDAQGKRTSNILEFDEKIFGDRVHKALLKNAVLMYEARQRVGTHSTKTRRDCSGTGRKLWRQKGTGRARTGPGRAPHWRGGGVVFGPHPRDYSYTMPKKARRLALNSALLAKFQDREIKIIEDFGLEDTPKTQKIYGCMNEMGIAGARILIGIGEESPVLLKSVRNIPKASLEHIVRFNPYIIIAHKHVILVQSAFEKMVEERGGKVETLRREDLYK